MWPLECENQMNREQANEIFNVDLGMLNFSDGLWVKGLAILFFTILPMLGFGELTVKQLRHSQALRVLPACTRIIFLIIFSGLAGLTTKMHGTVATNLEIVEKFG